MYGCVFGRRGFLYSEAVVFQRLVFCYIGSVSYKRYLSYRVLSGNIGVVSEFENRQSRQFCMKTKMNVEKARREAMHMS